MGTVGYNNKILISDEKFGLGKNEKVNFLETPLQSKTPLKPSMKTNSTTISTTPAISKEPVTHEEEKIALILFMTGGFAIWFMFQ